MARGTGLASAVLALATGTLVVGLGRAGQTRSDAIQAPPTVSLYEAGTVQTSAPAPRAVVAGTQCDGNGNIYLVYSASIQPFMGRPQPLDLPLRKVSPGSESSTEFQAPTPPGYVRRFVRRFFVTPRGNVYGLILAFRHAADYKEGPDWPDSLVVKYKDDGSVDSITKLEQPQGSHFVAQKLGVFGDGSFLVTGAELELRGERPIASDVFTAVFDRAGAYVGPVTLSDDVRAETPQSQPAVGAKEPPQVAAGRNGDSDSKKSVKVPFYQEVGGGFMLASADGSIYLFRATSPARVYVILPGGLVTRQFHITPPASGLVPMQASLGGQGELLAVFTEPATASESGPVMALVDPQTGQVLQVVAAPPPTAGFLGCLSPEGAFLFVRTSKDEHLEVAKFVSR